MTTVDPQTKEHEHVVPNSGTVPNPSHDRQPTSVRQDVFNFVRGFCMGAADTVPGVSGGTVALILGHYQRLVNAISRIDRRFVSDLLSQRWRQAWDYVDGRFLLALLCGIGFGIISLAGLMHWLLDHHMPQTFAVFFGLILASVWIVRRYIQRWSPGCYAACLGGIIAALLIGRMSPTAGGDSLVYLFLSASIAICAMILPGISGAFVLLLLGVYHPVTGMIKETAKGHLDAGSLLQLVVFATGCLFGLLAFSRVLRWLLQHHRSVTMAALVGLMLGSVEKLWPLQVPTPETAGLKMKERVMQVVAPADWNGSLTLLIVLAVAAATAVLLLERVAAAESITERESDG
ncbi:DUF368 domain-containing protein [Stieleria sp. TO1_6]|uniref:DUF368 domain-containing protein n=1 Tax=Stieleria tagensis TaxID=2956795 RepID=UPI00209AEC95|nr:DUF368 domain-containing protein [Stieleria tagensis]MCO8123406.1 DUF368 domain-containing protein [Stieleria tagensis]